MKILFADKFPAEYLTQLQDLGHECVLEPDLQGDDLPAAIADHEVLVVRSTQVSADTIAAGSSLKLVIRAGAGTNTIDKTTAAEKGVPVCNVPGKNAVAVAELAMGLLLAIDRNIPDNVSDLRAGKWDKKRYSVAQGLLGRSIGIYGLGAIGLAMAERAAAFGMNIHVVAKPDRSPEVTSRLQAIQAVEVNNLEDLAVNCDVLSFHVPASDDTKGLVNGAFLARVREGAIIINTSRGDIVDETALISAMDSKGIRAGLDVYANEPGSGQADFDSALAKHPNVYGTHHIGASTNQAQDAVAEGVIEIIQAFDNGQVLHCVNMPA